MRVILTFIDVKKSPFSMVSYNLYHANYVFAHTGGQSLVFQKVPYETEIKWCKVSIGCKRIP
jgi:hypothetical protein